MLSYFFPRRSFLYLHTISKEKKATAPGKVSNGRQYIIDFNSVKKFEKIWIFQEVTLDLRKKSAVMQTPNSGKWLKIFIPSSPKET